MEIEIESTYNRPDLCLLSFDLDADSTIPSQFELGTGIEVTVKGEQATESVFKGEVTALDFDATEHRTVFVVQCEDKLHRLYRGDKTRVFENVSISDVVSQLANGAGVPVGAVDSTATTYKFLMQQNVSDGQWILEQAAQLGFHLWAEAGELCFGPVGKGGDSGVTLKHGQLLMSFKARVTANAFMKEAAVRGWDVVQKKEIVGKATSFTARKDSKVVSAFSDSPGSVLVRTASPAQADAEKIAKAALERANEHNLQAEGRCFGNAKLKVDKEVAIEAVNERFNGKYRISHVRHRFTDEIGFVTEFSCRGAADHSLSSLVQEAATGANVAADRSIFDGVAVGIVTDNNDPDGLGRVKVKLPTLGENLATDWMRIAFPGGGGNGTAHHGWYLLPEIDDEVLVIFEQGDARRGYVLGGLHNGKDKPFYKNDKVLTSGKVNQHAFRMKNGAHLLFDETEGKEVLELKSKGDKFLFKFSEEKGVELTNQATGDKLVVTNKGDITVTSDKGNITVEAKAGGLDLKAAKDINIESSGGKVNIKAAMDAALDGLNVKVNGQMNTEVKGGVQAALDGGATAIVKGGVVMIN